MDDSDDRNRVTDSEQFWARAQLLVLSLAVVALSLWLLRYFLVTGAAAVCVAILLGPLRDRLSLALKGRRSLAVSLVVLTTAIVILLPLTVYGVLVGQQAIALYDVIRPRLDANTLRTLWEQTLPERYPWLEALATQLGLREVRGLLELVAPALSEIAQAANRVAQGMLTQVTSIVLYLVLFLLVLFFALRDSDALGHRLKRLLPLSETEAAETFEHVSRTLKGVLYTMVVVPLAQGLLSMLGFRLFGLPAPLLWGTLTIFAAAVPGVGSAAVWLPAAIYLIFASGWWQGLGLLLYGLLIVGLADNVIKPILLQKTAQIHTLLAFLALVGGLLTFGPVGLLLGPVVLSLLLSTLRILEASQTSTPIDNTV